MTSHAYTNRASLPGKTSTLDTSEQSKRAFQASNTAKEPERPSTMVTKDHPNPQPRPSPGMAQDVDRSSFNARWAQEQKAATQSREERKAAFIKERTDPRTGGHVRVLKNTFNR